MIALNFMIEESSKNLAEAVALRKRAKELELGKTLAADFKAAADLMRQAAEMGDPQAQYWYGRYLEFGYGVERNLGSAIEYYTKSGENGFAEGQLKLGLLYYRGECGLEKDFAKAAILFEKASKKSLLGMFYYGLCLEKGRGVEQDLGKAFELYKEAAKSGITRAMYRFGLLLEKGICGRDPKPEIALNWFKHASEDTGSAQESVANAQWKYGVYLEGGKYIEQDFAKAAEMYRKAADRGCSPAMFALANLLEKGRGVPMNKKEAFQYYAQAAHSGLTYAKLCRALCLKNGTGVRRSWRAGVEELKTLAADASSPAAQLAYGKHLMMSDNIGEAIEYYKRAAFANPGNSEAKFCYGICLLFGIGCSVSIREATRLFIQSQTPDALFFYGYAVDRAGNREKGVEYYGKAMNGGSPWGKLWFGQFLLNGIYTELNLEKGKKLIREAVDEIAERIKTKDPETIHFVEHMKKKVNRSTRVYAYVVDINDLEVVKELGSGQFGSVKLLKVVKPTETGGVGELWAGKFMKAIPRSNEFQDSAMFMQEADILAALNHPCVVNIKGISIPTDMHSEKMIATEYMSNGSISDLIDRMKSGHSIEWWNHTNISRIICGIVMGMRYIHRRNVLHRDLKPANVLIDENYKPRIADLGLSRFDSLGLTMTTQVGTPLYMAPEMFDTGTYTNRIDVYSFGLMLYEILTLKCPFQEGITAMQHLKVLMNEERPQIPDTIRPEIRMIIAQSWHTKPEQRLSFDEIYAELRKINFKVYEDADEKVIFEYVEEITRAENTARVIEMIEDD